jgi:ADP-dependent NAD(P)H-hydrate dehydratase / NAD(P)H-hydrate epimerase
MDAQRIETLPALPERPLDGHKGTFGTVAIVGGSAGMHHDEQFAATMIGAPALAALGAVRAGCGLVKIASPSPIIESVLTLAPFATGFGLEVDAHRAIIASSAAPIIDELVRTSGAIVVGPGMGIGDEIGQIVVRLVGQDDVPVVVDADGLNALASMPDFVRDIRASMVLTPHPGEAKRLMSALAISGDPAGDESERVRVCTALAQRIGCVVVLKGRGTVVSDGHRVWVCTHGTPAMGVGGTGDVLSGVIGSLIAQRGVDLFFACAIGVEAHAIAGERWVQSHQASGGMIASELADGLVGVIEGMRG